MSHSIELGGFKMHADEQAKIDTEINYTWGSLKRAPRDFPSGVDDLKRHIALWLDGETIEFVEFGWDDHEGGNAYESNKLWGLILSTRFLATIDVPKRPESTAIGQFEWALHARNTISNLNYEWTEPSPDPLLLIHATYTEAGEIVIPRTPWSAIPNDLRKSIFVSLRDDLYPRSTRLHLS